jgi:hypothetical protein
MAVLNKGKCLFVGGPKDGQWMVIDRDAKEFRVAIRALDAEGEHTEVTYVPVKIAGVPKLLTVLAPVVMAKRGVMQLLIDGYRRPLEGNGGE